MPFCHVSNPPTPLGLGIEQVDAWFESPTLSLLSENAESWTILRTLISKAKVKEPQMHDARIVALCQAHGVRTLWSADRDFSRFPISVENPLVS